MKKKKITVAVSGASGSIYARLLVQHLMVSDAVEVTLIFSTNGREVTEQEEGLAWLEPFRDRIRVVGNRDFGCSVASGSGHDEAMVVVPCSVGMLSRIATGQSDDLISRGADVMLKERRTLILVVRETPLNLIHLRNMVQLTEAGGIVLPAAPSFYGAPRHIEELCMSVVNRILRLLGIESGQTGWGEGAQEK